MDGERRGTTHRVYSAYTALSLTAPTLIATVVAIADNPTATGAYLAVLVGALLLAVQQVGSLVSGDAWPTRARPRLHLPEWLVGPPALTLGVLAGIGVSAHGFRAGRPILLWAVPGAAALGILTLAVTQWEREVPRWSRGSAALVIALAAVLAGAAVLLAPAAPAAPTRVGLALAGVLVVVVAVLVVQVGQVWWDRVVTELSTAREALVEGAVREERLRFAGELHDLQGHELQVIMLRADLGASTLRVRGAAAVEEAITTFDEIRDTAQRALQQARDLVHGYRRADFAQEVGNAQSILRAAGITVSVTGPIDEVDGEAAHLAGLLIREAATNLLRHSRTTRARIDVVRHAGGFEVLVADPGPSRGPDRGHVPGSGLRSLAERARRVGYLLTSGPDGTGWSVRLSPEES